MCILCCVFTTPSQVSFHHLLSPLTFHLPLTAVPSGDHHTVVCVYEVLGGRGEWNAFSFLRNPGRESPHHCSSSQVATVIYCTLLLLPVLNALNSYWHFCLSEWNYSFDPDPHPFDMMLFSGRAVAFVCLLSVWSKGLTTSAHDPNIFHATYTVWEQPCSLKTRSVIPAKAGPCRRWCSYCNGTADVSPGRILLSFRNLYLKTYFHLALFYCFQVSDEFFHLFIHL